MRLRYTLAACVALVLAADGVFVALTSGSSASRHPAKPALAVVPKAPAPAATTPADPDSAGRVQPPAPGLYRYHETSAAADGRSFDWAERITVAPGDAGVIHEHIRTTTPPGIDEAVDLGSDAETEVAYSEVGTSIAGELSCDQVPRTLLQLPLSVGSTWVTSTSCTNLLNQTLTQDRRVRVVGQTTLPVGGQTVSVWELVAVTVQQVIPGSAIGTNGVSKSSSTAPPPTVVPAPVTTTTTLDVSARYGLLIRQVVQVGQDPSTIRTDQLVSLTPS